MKATKALIFVLAIVMLSSLAFAATSHTRFTHLNEYCIYYDGVKQCKVKDGFCDPNGGNTPTELGLCANLGDDVLLEPTASAEPAYDGTCPITVNEGELVDIDWSSGDPDEDIGPQGYLSYEFSGVLGEDGKWQTQRGDAGIHSAKARVYDGEFWDETELCIEVLKVNEPAKVSLASNDVTVYEGETVTLGASCTDADGDATTISYSGWMTSDTKSTGYNDAGVYDVTVTCEDTSGEGASVDVTVTVLNRNRPPTIQWVQK